ncbi:MAG: hypothetical protein JNK25_00060 [Phycisphaerae bacterium]|nr:hypothetical protein [Phycisphaerae bacterium]
MNNRFDQTVARLSDDRAGVRRIAALDLCNVIGHPEALEAGIARLKVEVDPSVMMYLIRALAVSADPRAGQALAAVRDDRQRHAAVSHAALLAYDAVELSTRER